MTFEISGKKKIFFHIYFGFFIQPFINVKFESLEFLKTFISENDLQHETSTENSF